MSPEERLLPIVCGVVLLVLLVAVVRTYLRPDDRWHREKTWRE